MAAKYLVSHNLETKACTRMILYSRSRFLGSRNSMKVLAKCSDQSNPKWPPKWLPRWPPNTYIHTSRGTCILPGHTSQHGDLHHVMECIPSGELALYIIHLSKGTCIIPRNTCQQGNMHPNRSYLPAWGPASCQRMHPSRNNCILIGCTSEQGHQ